LKFRGPVDKIIILSFFKAVASNRNQKKILELVESAFGVLASLCTFPIFLPDLDETHHLATFVLIMCS
jgi:hypothetical protein